MWRVSWPSSMPGCVVGVGHVDRDRDVRLVAVGGCACAIQTDLLLDDGHAQARHRERRRPPPPAARRARPRNSRRGCPASARRRRPFGKLERLHVDHARVADPHALARLVARGGADVDVQALELGARLALILFELVDRLAADYAAHLTVTCGQHDALPDQLDRIPAADLPEAQEALVVDVGDVDADLVDVADDRQGTDRRRSPANTRPRGPVDIDVDLGRERLNQLAPGGRGPSLLAGRAGYAQQRVRAGLGWAYGGSPLRTPAAGAARTAGCLRAGSTSAPWECRFAP